MCGFIYSPMDPIPEHLPPLIEHRGLRSKWFEDRMYFRRLPIVSDSERADQPITVNGITIMMVGEVFNYKELIGDVSPTDAAAFGMAFERLHEFEGFWAVVMEDQSSKRAVVMTDFLGIKPVYFHKRHLVFCNELEPLVQLDESPVEDKVFIGNCYKWGYDPTGRTPWADIAQIKPGHLVEINLADGYWEEKEYWKWERVPVMPLNAAMKQAVEHRLQGVMAVSHLLSGGLDSSIIASYLPKGTECFYVDNEEAEFAEEVAYLHQLKLTKLETNNLREDTRNAILALQMPVDLGSMVPQFRLARAVRGQGYTVCMSGDGADELFGGYSRNNYYDSQYSDVFVELPYWHLRRLDMLPMHFTIEQRCPFLSPRVIAAALRMPWLQRRGKAVLKKEFKTRVPESVLKREKKALKMEERWTTKELIKTWRKG